MKKSISLNIDDDMPCYYCRTNLNHITIVDRMGFTKNEAKEILLRCPNLYKSRFEDKLQLQ